MRRRFAALFSTALILLAATACGTDDGGGDNGSDTAQDGGPDTVTVGLIPIVDVAPLFLGQQEGFFEDRDIELETEFAAGGAEIIPGVQSGQFDFGFSNVISLMLAQEGGIELQVVSNGNNSTGEEGEDFGSLMVPADSDVESAADLEGARVATNTLNNIVQTIVNASVRKAGGDPSTIEYVGVPFPEMEAALANGDVDAAFPVEPFQTIIRNNEVGRSIAWSWVDAAPDLTVAAYFTTAELAESDSDLVQRFTEAMQESLAYADENPDAVREILPEYTELSPELAAELTLPTWPPEVNRESVQQLADQAVQDGLLSQQPDLDTLFP